MVVRALFCSIGLIQRKLHQQKVKCLTLITGEMVVLNSKLV